MECDEIRKRRRRARNQDSNISNEIEGGNVDADVNVNAIRVSGW